MVRKLCDDGVHYYHEPPYTEAEEDELYRRMDAGPFARIVHAPATKRTRSDDQGHSRAAPRRDG